MIELKYENELFLQFCMAYGTPEQEKYRKAYERADEKENAEKMWFKGSRSEIARMVECETPAKTQV